MSQTTNIGGLNSGYTYGMPNGVANGMSEPVNLWNREQGMGGGGDMGAAVVPATLTQPIYFQGQNYGKDIIGANAVEMNTTPPSWGAPLGWALRA